MPTPFQVAAAASIDASERAQTRSHVPERAAISAQIALAQAELAKAHAVKDAAALLAAAIVQVAQALQQR